MVKEIMMKRSPDLSLSSIRKLNYYNAIIDSKSDKITPDSCLRLLKYFSEERNAALHGPLMEDAK